MPTNSYTASLNYYDSSYGWANEGTCSQGNCTPWGGGSARTGVMYFSGLSSLKGKIINSVTFTVTNGESGYGYDAYKTAQFYRSARQGGISTSLGASHKTGGVIGTWRNMFHALNGTTMSFNPTFFSSHIKNGDDTFCIYSNDASDYFKWKKVQISVNWSEPYTTTTGWSVTSSIALGSSGTVSMPSLSGSNANNYHTVTYQTSAGGYSGTISSRLTSGQSATFAPSLSWAAAIPSSTTMTCTITTTTYTSSGSWVGANSKTITLTVPDNSSTKPSCSVSATAVDPAGNDAYVSGFSQVQANMHNMAGQYGASVRTYSISMTGWSTSGSVSGSSMTATSPILSGSGSRTITLTVTDSRGFSNSATTSFTVLSYTRPLITSFQAFRTSSSTSTTQDLTGSYLRVVIQLAPSSPSISGNTHTGTLSCSPSVSGMPSSVTSNYSQNFSVSNGVSYNLSFTYGDEYSKSTATVSVSSVAVPLDIRFNGTAIGIGKYAESNNMVDIGLNTRIREDLQVDGSITWPSKHQITYQDIPNGANLNTYLHPGFYRSRASANTGIINKPADCNYAFELIVTGISDTSYCTQRVKAHASNTEWIRTQTSWQEPYNTWTNWTKIVKSDDLSGSLANYAQLASPNNLVHSSNECTFIPSGFSGGLWFNYRTVGDTNGSLSQYNFGNGSGGGLANISVRSLLVNQPAETRTNLGFGKVIWMGTWSSGSISVSELTSYRLLGFDISGSSLLILGARDRDTSSSDIRAFGVVHSGDNAQADAFMLAASYSGGTLTMSDCYSVNVITGAKTTRSIYAIIGIS